MAKLKKYHGQSIRRRLFVSACVVLCIFLGATGFVLDHAFSAGLKSTIREKLKLLTFSVISVAEIDTESGLLEIPVLLADQRFNRQGEKLVALVTDSLGHIVWQSKSAQGRNFAVPSPQQGQWLFGRFPDANGEAFFSSSYSTSWPTRFGEKLSYDFTVMESEAYYADDLTGYRANLSIALLVIGCFLLSLQALIFHWGLGPLHRLAKDVEAMDKGETDRLQGGYPNELEPLVASLNLLIANERRQRERYRNTLADLSHSLKTPLAVLTGIESDINQDGAPISRESILTALNKQVAKMSGIINYQLQRAVIRQGNISIVASPIKPEVFSVLNALGKVYADKSVRPVVDVPADASFYGDENDLVEILGNLLDNAYKYCHQQVKLSVSQITRDGDTAPQLQLLVEDDGPGISESYRAAILQRGVRLDSKNGGQGIGLAVVVDIVDTYQGDIDIGDSELGGAKVGVILPGKQV
jgi:two-component system, OmpR family, sensor histidine kinase PhoQ